jgi:enamine deaminase RidA (YjgF/YER057c/UK114 family)
MRDRSALISTEWRGSSKCSRWSTPHPDSEDHPKVINGCSDLFVEVVGENGQRACSVVGMISLPAGIPVEIEVIVAVK